MKVFECGHCSYPLFFENDQCENCGHLCGYRDSDRKMLTFDPLSSIFISDREKIEYKYCRNYEYEVCNWLLEKNDKHDYCPACQLNRTIPNLSYKSNFPKWKNLEVAKHRLIYQLQKIGLELTHVSPKTPTSGSVVFEFTYTAPAAPGDITLYANGNSVNLNGQNTGDSWNFASNKIVTVQTPTDVDDDNLLAEFKLEQNYPNPFNPSTKINFSLAQSSDVKVVVYSTSGEEITTLINEYKNAGTFSIDTNNFVETKKMLFIK